MESQQGLHGAVDPGSGPSGRAARGCGPRFWSLGKGCTGMRTQVLVPQEGLHGAVDPGSGLPGSAARGSEPRFWSPGKGCMGLGNFLLVSLHGARAMIPGRC